MPATYPWDASLVAPQLQEHFQSWKGGFGTATCTRGRKPSTEAPKRGDPAATEAVQLQVRQLELKQLELEPKVGSRAKEGKLSN